jgi:2,3-bisphosphoglycerate-dependent phosphoglycerate mutase
MNDGRVGIGNGHKEGENKMTKVYFVRHAEPVHAHADDRTRPLTAEGLADRKIVLETLKDKEIDVFYCSPYVRSMTTVEKAAAYFEKDILTDERLREREKGNEGNSSGNVLKMRWADFSFHEEGGESIGMVQERNIAALKEILAANEGKNIVVGTHGTALSSILNYYNRSFDCGDFLRIVDWMPYIIELDFEGTECVEAKEHAYVEKAFPERMASFQK